MARANRTRGIKTKKGKHKVGERLVNDHFAPVKAQAPDPVQVHDAVVGFVQLPQCRHPMQKVMNAPVQKVDYKKSDKKLNTCAEVGRPPSVEVLVPSLVSEQVVQLCDPWGGGGGDQ